MDEIFEETKAFLQRRCIANCGHNANESCICNIDLCFKEIENAEISLQRLAAIEKGKNTDIIDNYMAFQNIKETEPSEALDNLFDLVTCQGSFEKAQKCYDILEEALTEFKRLDLSLRLPSEQSSSHFTYKNKNLVCMQLTKYTKLMNAFLEYEKAQELEKVLEIIKEKRVDMETLENAIFREKAKQVKSGLQWYNNQVKFHSNKYLTQEEFDTLMRWQNGKRT